MKTSTAATICTLVFSLSFASATRAQSMYEGTITLALIMAADSEKTESTINVKGDKMEIELDAGVQGIIKLFPDSKKNTLRIAIMAVKNGKEVPLPPANATDVTIDLKPNGKQETVDRHAVEGFTLSIPQADFVLWATNELPENLRVALGSALPHIMQEDGNIIAALHQLAAKKMVPIKIEVAPKGMPDQNATIEFVKAEAKKMDDAIFELPKDITFTTMPPPGAKLPRGDEGTVH